DTYRRQKNDACVGYTNPGSGTGAHLIVGSFNSFISDGVRINFTTVNATQRRGFVILIAGDEAAARADVLDLSSGANDVTAPGFSPTFVLFARNEGSAFADASNAQFILNFGIATSTAQKGIMWAEGD